MKDSRVFNNEYGLSAPQIHFLRTLLDGKREIGESESAIRREKLGLDVLRLPCVVVCVSPYYSGVDSSSKDDLLRDCSEFICGFLAREGFEFFCLTNSYDNYQIILPTDANGIKESGLDELFIELHSRFSDHFGLDSFIGIGSVAGRYCDISRSALEAMEMLAYKNRYSDRGVISINNTYRFKHYSIYGEDIMFARVIGRFQDGDPEMMRVRLNELVESVRNRPGVSGTSIKRTFIELAVNVLHIASNANIDADSVLDGVDFYNWILRQNHTEVLTEWFMDLCVKLMEKMRVSQKAEENEIISQACEYIAENISDPDLGLQSVSDNAGLSVAYFSQLFKTEKGIGLNSYITENRVTNAMKLLETTELKAEEITERCGFSTASYFGRVFKKQTGMTPREYRSRSRGAQDSRVY